MLLLLCPSDLLGGNSPVYIAKRRFEVGRKQQHKRKLGKEQSARER